MLKLRTLLLLELRSLFGLNRFRHSQDRGFRARYRGLALVWLLLLGVVFVYVGGLVYGLCRLGLHRVVPSYLTVLASLLILAFGLFTAGNTLFGGRGYDLLASMPVRTWAIVSSRLGAMYVQNLLLTLAVLTPGIVVYGDCQRPGIGFYPAALLGAVLIPAIPTALSVGLGTLVLGLSSRVGRKSLVQTALMLLLVLMVLGGSFRMEELSEQLTPQWLCQMAQRLGTVFATVYPPARWLETGLLEGDAAGLGLFAAASCGAAGITVLAASWSFHGILRRLRSHRAGKAYSIGNLKSRSLLWTLYIREVRRYFSSSVYVTNTILGPILGTALSLALGFGGLDAVEKALGTSLELGPVLPFAVAGVFCTMTATSTAISMEGRQFWIIKSLPIPTKVLLDSKILLNLSLMLPFYLVSAAVLVLTVKPGLTGLLWLWLIPASVILFSVVFGITVNLKFHSFDWEKEETVVKQSLSALLGGFAGMLLALVLGAAAFLTPPEYGSGARALMCLALWVATAALYRKNNTVSLQKL